MYLLHIENLWVRSCFRRQLACMSPLHTKCSCEEPVVHRHGSRRRRCADCGKTWSIRPKRHGRRPRRATITSVSRLLVDGESTRRLAKDCHRSVEVARHRCRIACRRLVAKQALPSTLPLGDMPLVLLVDGLWCCFANQTWVVYSMAVKPAGVPTAFFLDPVLLAGRESARNWLCALASIPEAIDRRIKALVSDGFKGSKLIIRRRGWILQRCHWHLDMKLFGKPGSHRRLRGGVIRERIFEMIKKARSTNDRLRLEALQQILAEQACDPGLSPHIRGVIRRFLLELPLYRSYLSVPELELPSTTNAIESRHSQLRKVTHGINNPQALILRIRAYTRLHPTITCNGHKIPQV